MEMAASVWVYISYHTPPTTELVQIRNEKRESEEKLTKEIESMQIEMSARNSTVEEQREQIAQLTNTILKQKSQLDNMPAIAPGAVISHGFGNLQPELEPTLPALVQTGNVAKSQTPPDHRIP